MANAANLANLANGCCWATWTYPQASSCGADSQLASICLQGQTQVQKDEGPKHSTATSPLDRQDPKALEISLRRDFEGITSNGAYMALLPVRVLVFCNEATKDHDDTIIQNDTQP